MNPVSLDLSVLGIMATLVVEHGEPLSAKIAQNLSPYSMEYHKNYHHLLHLSGQPNSEASSPVASTSNARSSPNLNVPENGADIKVYNNELLIGMFNNREALIYFIKLSFIKIKCRIIIALHL